MELLGGNLDQLMEISDQKFSLKTTLLIADQMAFFII